MINALHPIESKEGEEIRIHNQEAWQLTRWLEEGVFGKLYRRNEKQMHLRRDICVELCLPSMTTRRTKRNRNYWKPIHV